MDKLRGEWWWVTSCVTRAIVNIRMAWSLQRGKTEGTKSIVSKVIYGRRGVYQFASGRCERAWNARLPPPPPPPPPRYLHQYPLLLPSPFPCARARPTATDFSYINFSTFKNKRPLLTLSPSPSLSLSLRPHLIIFRLGRERRDE